MWLDLSGDSRLMKYGKTEGQELLLWLKKLTGRFYIISDNSDKMCVKSH